MDRAFPDKLAKSKRRSQSQNCAAILSVRRLPPFPGTDGGNRYSNLTGRQSPSPVTAKLRSIYSEVLAEKLPDKMVKLLSQLDSQPMDKE